VVAGGVASNGNPTTSAQLYDPSTGTFALTGSLHTARANYTATLLNSGLVLMAAGNGVNGRLASAELYDPASGTFSATGNLNTARAWQTGTLLNNGLVLVAGGGDPNANPLVLADEIGRHFKYRQRNDLADDDITRICGTKY
jgi:hypothetical protein